MERKGLLRRVRGKGTFIHENAHTLLRSGLDAFALILPDTQVGFYPSLLAGFEAAAGNLRSQVLVINTRNDPHRQADGILQLIDKKVAGVALVPTMSPPTPAYQVRQLQQHHIPVVLCHRPVEGVCALRCWRSTAVPSEDSPAKRSSAKVIARSRSSPAFARIWPVDTKPGCAALEQAGASLPEARVIYLEAEDYTDLPEYDQRVDRAITRLLRRPIVPPRSTPRSTI